jgi:hypothetical protein
VFRGVREVLLRTKYVRHTHQFVVDDDREVIRRKAVLLANNEIIDFTSVPS